MDTEETGRPSVPAAQLLRADTDGRVRSARPTQFSLRLTPAGEDAGQRSGEGVTTASPRRHSVSAVQPPMMASASISTNMAGSMRARTSTIDVAGRIAPNASPWARPTDSQSRAMFTT